MFRATLTANCSIWNRSADTRSQSWKENAINPDNDDYLNSALAEDHRAFGYRGNMDDPDTNRSRPRWPLVAALLVIAAVGYAGFTW